MMHESDSGVFGGRTVIYIDGTHALGSSDCGRGFAVHACGCWPARPVSRSPLDRVSNKLGILYGGVGE
jgi:hypothetical protein